eukprot:jgi/Galph1/726/GphlegSOOS_G5457.1
MGVDRCSQKEEKSANLGETQDTQSVTSTSFSQGHTRSTFPESIYANDFANLCGDFTYSVESKLGGENRSSQDDRSGQSGFQKGRRKPGRPPSLFVDKSDSELTEEERKVKAKIIKRRLRQNRSYQRRKLRKQVEGAGLTENPSRNFVTSGALFSSSKRFEHQPFQYAEETMSPLFQSGTNDSNLPYRSIFEKQKEVFQASRPLTTAELSGIASSSWIPGSNRLLLGPSNAEYPGVHNRPEGLGFEQTFKEYTSDKPEPSALKESSVQEDVAYMYLQKLFNNLSPLLQRTLFLLSIFPGVFDISAARFVISESSSDNQREENSLNILNEQGFLVEISPKRFQVDPLSKQFLLREILCSEEFKDWNLVNVGKTNFVRYYTDLLKFVDNERMILDGSSMEQALRICDLERANFECCLLFAQELGNQSLRHAFISGSNILRLFIPASERISLLLPALGISTGFLDDPEFNNSPLDTTNTTKESLTEDATPIEKWQEDALLWISLGEAYADDLRIKEAERAFSLSLMLIEKSGLNNKPCVLIPLMGLSNIFRETDRVDQALELLHRALDKLSQFHLENSSYGVHVYESLTITLIIRNQREQAQYALSNLLRVIKNVHFEGLPLYSDVLGTLGIFSLVSRNIEAADGYFRQALENYGSFLCRSWSRVPIESCRDLELWILDNLSKALMLLDRSSEASRLQEQIEVISRVRGVRVRNVDSFENEEDFISFSSPNSRSYSEAFLTSGAFNTNYWNYSGSGHSLSKSDSDLKATSHSEHEGLFLDDATMILYHRIFIRHIY